MDFCSKARRECQGRENWRPPTLLQEYEIRPKIVMQDNPDAKYTKAAFYLQYILFAAVAKQLKGRDQSLHPFYD